jgi:hypothetical protein
LGCSVLSVCEFLETAIDTIVLLCRRYIYPRHRKQPRPKSPTTESTEKPQPPRRRQSYLEKPCTPRQIKVEPLYSDAASKGNGRTRSLTPVNEAEGSESPERTSSLDNILYNSPPPPYTSREGSSISANRHNNRGVQETSLDRELSYLAST